MIYADYKMLINFLLKVKYGSVEWHSVFLLVAAQSIIKMHLLCDF